SRPDQLHVDRQSFLALRFGRLLLHRGPPVEPPCDSCRYAVQPHARVSDLGQGLSALRRRFTCVAVVHGARVGFRTAHRRIPVLLARGGEPWSPLSSQSRISSRRTCRFAPPSTPTIPAIGSEASGASAMPCARAKARRPCGRCVASTSSPVMARWSASW